MIYLVSVLWERKTSIEYSTYFIVGDPAQYIAKLKHDAEVYEYYQNYTLLFAMPAADIEYANRCLAENGGELL